VAAAPSSSGLTAGLAAGLAAGQISQIIESGIPVVYLDRIPDRKAWIRSRARI